MLKISFLLIATLGITLACDLIPNDPNGSCFELRSTPFITSQDTQFGVEIEGASVNKKGEFFAVNYGTQGGTLNQLGQVTPTQKLIYQDSNFNSHFNGIRFLNETTAYAADKRHRVLELTIDPNSNMVTSTRPFCTDQSMIEPNDLCISKAGTVFTSGQNWISDSGNTDGDIWSCTQDGKVTKLESLGRTNGIEISPDERTLYVSEAYTRSNTPYQQIIWRYDVDVVQGTISNKRQFADFQSIDGSVSVDIDGMRTDVNSNLWVTRHGGREVVVFNPNGQVIGKVATNFPRPTNLEFGGPLGKTLYIVGACESGGAVGCVDMIEVSAAGRAFTNLQ